MKGGQNAPTMLIGEIEKVGLHCPGKMSFGPSEGSGGGKSLTFGRAEPLGVSFKDCDLETGKRHETGIGIEVIIAWGNLHLALPKWFVHWLRSTRLTKT